MLIQLPVETWIEILDWLRRRDLVKKLDQLWDRQFTKIAQDWLHKYTRNVSIGELRTNKDGLLVRNKAAWEKVPFADVDLPENVTNFKSIIIGHFDSTLLALLRRMRPLFRNVCLGINTKNEASTQTVLLHLMPMIDSNITIKALSFDHQALPFFSANHSSVFFNAKLLRTQNNYSDDELVVTWLFTRRVDGQPRLFWLNREDSGLYEKIQERFLDPARQCASPFFILYYLGFDSPNASAIENVRTGEQLSLQQDVDGRFGLISNCPSTVDPDWLANKHAELLNWDWDNEDRRIFLHFPDIGPIDVVDDQQHLEDDQ